MKKSIILAAIALIAGVSCTKQIPMTVYNYDSPDAPIKFEPISQKLGTKAIAGEQSATYSLANNAGTFESFKAWARFSDAAATKPSDATVEFFSGVVCNPNKTAATPDYWELATKYYWPKNGYLSFHAFSPSDLDPAPTETWGTGFELAYTVATNAANQIDLLYSDYELGKSHNSTVNNYTSSTVSYDDENDGTYVYDGVNLLFHHALASIGFQVKLNDNAYYTQGHNFKVKKIEVIYPYQTGTFHENRDAASTSNAYASTVPAASAGYENVGFAWNDATLSPYWTVDQSSELDPTSGTYVAYDYATGTAVTSTTPVVLYNAPSNLVEHANYILAMPQTLVHSSHTVSAKVSFSYQYGSGAVYDLETTVPLYTTGKAGTDVAEGSVANVDKWLIGHKYIYTLNFKLDEIIFDPAVAGFVNVTVDAIDVPVIS